MVQPDAVTATSSLQGLEIREYKGIAPAIVVRFPTLVQPCPTAGCERDRRGHQCAGLGHPVVVERLEEKGQGFRS